jgi:hypothetical protein
MKKITRTTIKKFIKDNKKGLYIKKTSDFDGMIDCVREVDSGFIRVPQDSEFSEYTLGVPGAWFVGSSRDYFQPYSDDFMIGYSISNCCGSFILAFQR